MHLFLEALAASAGGGLTYLRNVLPHLAASPNTSITVLLRKEFQPECESSASPSCANVSFLNPPLGGEGVLNRFRFLQREVPRMAQASGADVLIATGNVAVRRCPLPQILLSRNALYTSADWYRDLRRRQHWALLLDSHIKGWLVGQSVRWADCTVAPSHAFAQELQAWTGAPVRALHHGFDTELFFRDANPLAATVQAKLDESPDALRLLLVSHYNYYRNFETLLRALPLIRSGLGGRSVRLFLTCRLTDEANPGVYQTAEAAALVTELGIRHEVVELGAIPYPQLYRLYEACHTYVSPAYAETFAHPLVEAMACGRPLVVSDIPVHAEIAGDAGLRFSRFSPAELASRVLELAHDPGLSSRLAATGRERSGQFSWACHVEQLLILAGEVCLLRHLD